MTLSVSGVIMLSAASIVVNFSSKLLKSFGSLITGLNGGVNFLSTSAF